MKTFIGSEIAPDNGASQLALRLPIVVVRPKGWYKPNPTRGDSTRRHMALSKCDFGSLFKRRGYCVKIDFVTGKDQGRARHVKCTSENMYRRF